MSWNKVLQSNPAGLMTYAQASRQRGKIYIVYVAGEEKGYLAAPSTNAAEKKAWAMFPSYEKYQVSAEYTEL